MCDVQARLARLSHRNRWAERDEFASVARRVDAQCDRVVTDRERTIVRQTHDCPS